MRHEDWEQIKRTADRVARNLHADARAGKLKKIGIEEICKALDAEVDESKFDSEYLDKLEEQTTRRVVELVG
jgi:hypothetical protein